MPAAAATLKCTGQSSPEVSPRASAGLQASVENDLSQLATIIPSKCCIPESKYRVDVVVKSAGWHTPISHPLLSRSMARAAIKL